MKNLNEETDGLITDTNKTKPKRRILSEKERAKIEETIDKNTKVEHKDIINFEEVAIRKSLFFRLYVGGTIEYGNFSDTAPINVKYEFVYGNDWEKEDGLIKDTSQFSCKGDGSYNYYSFNQQFEISFRSINPYGWPQLVITCCTVDGEGNEVVKGYGCIHVPSSTGRHERKVHIFSSTTDQSFWGKLCGMMKGKTNEVANTPKVISSGEGREISRAICEGWIKVVFQVSFRDMDKFGYISN